MRFTAETRGCLKCENFSPAYMNGGKYDRTDDFLRTKFLGCIDNQIFLPIVLRHARERRQKSFNFYAFSLKTIKTQAV